MISVHVRIGTPALSGDASPWSPWSAATWSGLAPAAGYGGLSPWSSTVAPRTYTPWRYPLDWHRSLRCSGPRGTRPELGRSAGKDAKGGGWPTHEKTSSKLEPVSQIATLAELGVPLRSAAE